MYFIYAFVNPHTRGQKHPLKTKQRAVVLQLPADTATVQLTAQHS